MPKKQTDELQDEIHQDDDPMLLNIQLSLNGGKVEVNREEVVRALLNPDTHVTAIAVMTLLHYFVDKKTFLKGMKKTDKDINKTGEVYISLSIFSKMVFSDFQQEVKNA